MKKYILFAVCFFALGVLAVDPKLFAKIAFDASDGRRIMVSAVFMIGGFWCMFQAVRRRGQ